MNQLIRYIESLDPIFTRIQVAKGYDWQNSQTISRSKLQSDVKLNFDMAAGDDIAVEFFFTFADDHEFFIGIKYVPQQLRGLTSVQFTKAMLALGAKTNNPEQLLQDAGKKLFGNSRIYLDRNVDRAVELVVNYWNEVGTVTIWKEGEKPLDHTGLQRKLATNSELQKTPKNPIVLEIDYGAPAMWVGIDVSRKIGKNYTIQSDIVLALLQIAQQGS